MASKAERRGEARARDCSAIEIKRATPKDMKLLMPLAFALQAYEAQLDESVKVTAKTKKDLERFVRKNLRRKDARFFMAFDKGALVGYASGWLSESNISASGKSYGFICDGYVIERFRGRGIGKLLIARMMDWFKEQGSECVEIYTHVNNIQVKELLNSRGFRPNMIRYLRKIGKNAE